MVVYSVSLLSTSQQTLQVEIAIPAISDSLHVSLPAWIPGSYKIRDFARNIGEFQVVDENSHRVKWEKLDKQSWRIEAQNRPVTLSYVVVANDFSVRGAFINDDYAFFNGTSVFVNIDEAKDLAKQVNINRQDCPRDWVPYSGMRVVSKTHSGSSLNEPHTFMAESYEELIDQPIYWGKAQVKTFHVDGVTFTFLLSGDQPIDVERITRDLEPICHHHIDMFGTAPPISEYLFITLLADKGYGGLEHKHSTVLMYPRFDLPLLGEYSSQDDENNSNASDSYIDYLSLCSHEFFHTWHVKRLRPKALLLPDLSREVYTNQLWIYEGITSFYDDLAVARAGKMPAKHYLTILGRHITRLYHTPGRYKQSPAESSFDAWTRFYQQDANSNNHIVSYYTKGGIIALGLDIVLRQQSDSKVSLDNVMRQLWEQYGVDERGTPDNVIQEICSQLGCDIQAYLNRVVYGTEDVPLEDLLPYIGLKLHVRGKEHSGDKGGTEGKEVASQFDIGASLSKSSVGVTVKQLQEHGAAEKAGLMINDTIIAADSWIVDETLLTRLLNRLQVGGSVELTVIREGRLVKANISRSHPLNRVAYLTVENEARYLSWLEVS